MRVLLTGADGFVGGHLATALADQGYRLIRAVYQRKAHNDELHIDLTSEAALHALPTPCDVVVHAAGIVDPSAGRARTFAANLSATEHLLRWAKSANVRHFVHLSSVAVYGPLVLGALRSEAAPRLGVRIGLPYMRSKALAELAIERAQVPYTLLRPPAVLGAGDSVVSPGMFRALRGKGVPLLPGASARHRVSLVTGVGLAQRVVKLVERGPLFTAIHTVDIDVSLADLAAAYAAQMETPCKFVRTSWSEALRRKNDAGFAWLAASGRFGQQYLGARELRFLGPPPTISIEQAVRAGLSSLQGIKELLS